MTSSEDDFRTLVGGIRAHVEAQQDARGFFVYAMPGKGTIVASATHMDALPEEHSALGVSDSLGVPNTPSASGSVLAAIREELGDCRRCSLSETRTNIVFGVGNPQAPLLFVGEAPGADEDRQGEPFVGRAGQLLDRMIVAMGWTRKSVYIANVLKCRPPGNRDPKPAEVEQCQPFLFQQIDAIQPKVIVTLGKPAAHLVLQTKAPISALRGKFHEFRGIPVMPTFHPAYLLRSPDRKRATWDDLQQVMVELKRLGVAPPTR